MKAQLFSDLLTILQETDNGIILGTQLAGVLGIYSGNEVRRYGPE